MLYFLLCYFGDVVKQKLRHFEAADREIVTPVLAALAYLKKIQCPKDIFCICGHVLRDSLKEAGYNIVEIKAKAEFRE
ncbi:hypothetical protein HUJ04_005333 [Dendroctonus ponderosae]|nr:hypothetical protein HUJ04_005333 [Dendroctonus ponderosae]